MAIIFHKVT